MISCADAVRQLWDYLDGEVTGTSRAEVEEHLDRCRRCCGEAEFAAELQGLLVAAADTELPSAVSRRLEGVLDELAATPQPDGEQERLGGPPGDAAAADDDQGGGR